MTFTTMAVAAIMAGPAFIIAITLFCALHSQTKRADRAEAALTRVEDEIANTARQTHQAMVVDKVSIKSNQPYTVVRVTNLTGMFDHAALDACADWQASRVEGYNCSLKDVEFAFLDETDAIEFINDITSGRTGKVYEVTL